MTAISDLKSPISNPAHHTERWEWYRCPACKKVGVLADECCIACGHESNVVAAVLASTLEEATSLIQENEAEAEKPSHQWTPESIEAKLLDRLQAAFGARATLTARLSDLHGSCYYPAELIRIHFALDRQVADDVISASSGKHVRDLRDRLTELLCPQASLFAAQGSEAVNGTRSVSEGLSNEPTSREETKPATQSSLVNATE